MSLVLPLFGPDAPGRRCPLIGVEQKFAARCQSDVIDPKRTSTLLGARFRSAGYDNSRVRLLPRSGGSANEASRFHRALEWCNGSLAAPCTRATTGNAGDWLPRYRLARHGGASGRGPSGAERTRVGPRPERDGRMTLGGGEPRGGSPLSVPP